MKPIEVGIVSRSFPTLTHPEIARLMADAGVHSAELCLVSAEGNHWVYNGRANFDGFTDKDFGAVAAAYRGQGISLPALGVFTNLIHPDAEERRQNLEMFEMHIRWAAREGIPVVSTECGFTPGQRGVNADRYESDFALLKESLSLLCECADRHGVTIALETCVIDIVPSAKRARDLLLQVGSDRLKILLDPANLIANSSEEDMFAYLAPHIAYFHGKDRKVNDAYGRMVGDGDIDWVKFLRLYHTHCEGKPFILEYVNLETYREALDRVHAYDEKARL